MTPSHRRLSIALGVLALAAPAVADDTMGIDQAESRLRACLIAGSASTGQNRLEAAVIQARAYCGAQIKRVRDLRVAAATRGLEGHEADEAKDRAIRQLNSEIAQAVANFTGLTL